MKYLGLSVNVNRRSIFISQHRPAVPGVKPDRNAATRPGIESVKRFEAVLVENVSDLQLVLVPTPEARPERVDRAFASPIQVDLHFRNLRPRGFRIRIRVPG